jgi:hypothetical protein
MKARRGRACEFHEHAPPRIAYAADVIGAAAGASPEGAAGACALAAPASHTECPSGGSTPCFRRHTNSANRSHTHRDHSSGGPSGCALTGFRSHWSLQ